MMAHDPMLHQDSKTLVPASPARSLPSVQQRQREGLRGTAHWAPCRPGPPKVQDFSKGQELAAKAACWSKALTAAQPLLLSAAPFSLLTSFS